MLTHPLKLSRLAEMACASLLRLARPCSFRPMEIDAKRAFGFPEFRKTMQAGQFWRSLFVRVAKTTHGHCADQREGETGLMLLSGSPVGQQRRPSPPLSRIRHERKAVRTDGAPHHRRFLFRDR
jgi:hypothetical protein